MPDAQTLERRLRQRSQLAEFALRAFASRDAVSVAEAASDAVCAGLGVGHAAVFERKSYGLDLLACSGWPGADGLFLEPPPGAVRALAADEPVAFESEGALAFGLATRADDAPARLLVAASETTLPLDDDDRAFVSDIGSVLRGAFARARTEQALRESEARARTSEARAHAVLDTTVDGIITIDSQGVVQSFNPAAERIFGYRAADVIGQNVAVLMPEPYHSHHAGYVQSYLETGRRRIIGIGREVIGKRRDGSTFPMELAVSEVVVPGLRMFTGIVRDISERRQLEREVVKGIEDERRRLGQELHDELGQQLSGIRMLTADLARRLADGDAGLAASAEQVSDLIREADNKARTIARGLVLVDVAAEGLAGALRHLGRRAQKLFSTPIRVVAEGEPVEIADTAATHLYRITQEAVTNAARHAEASEIVIRLAWSPETVCVSISDDGVGIEGATSRPTLGAATRPAEHRGLGIQSMIYRARLMSGVLDLSPSTSGGTVVTCAIPVQP